MTYNSDYRQEYISFLNAVYFTPLTNMQMHKIQSKGYVTFYQHGDGTRHLKKQELYRYLRRVYDWNMPGVWE